MKSLKSLIAIVALPFAVSAIATESALPLKIYRGNVDTVYSSNHIVVCVTSPGSVAEVNGAPVHVYSTGSFGTVVKLNEGSNLIDIKVSNGVQQASETLKVFLAKDKKAVSRQSENEVQFTSLDKYAKTMEGAYMQFGDGNDRLGGSKMGFLLPDIVMHVVGEIGDLYKVQLSNNRFAYVEKKYLIDTDEKTRSVNTGSWSVSNKGKFDRVYISLPMRLPYYSYTMLDPTTICVELFGAMNNSNWITQHGNLGIIDYVDYRHDESDVFKVIIKLKEKYAWGYSIDYNGSNIVIDVRHCPDLKLKNLTIGLDAGHGGKYPGAYSPSGLKEKDVNLDIVQRMRDILVKKGAKVVMSRDSDIDVSMSERKKIFKDANVDLMISVHNNAGGSPLTEMGTSVYYRQIANRPFANVMHEAMLELGVADYGLTGNFNFSLNGPTEYPNVLLEMLFMSSLIEEEKLASPEFRQKAAEKAIEGLERYLKKVKSEK